MINYYTYNTYAKLNQNRSRVFWLISVSLIIVMVGRAGPVHPASVTPQLGTSFHILLGGNRKTSRAAGAKNFLHFLQENHHIPHLKTIFSLDLVHYEIKIQLFCLYSHFFVGKLSSPPPKKSLNEANSVLGESLPPSKTPKRHPWLYSMTFSLRSNELVTLLTTKLRGKIRLKLLDLIVYNFRVRNWTKHLKDIPFHIISFRINIFKWLKEVWQ